MIVEDLRYQYIPETDHILLKLFFTFSDRSYCDLQFKQFYEKRSKQSYKQNTFFALITSN